MPFYKPKNRNLKKLTKLPGDIIILHKYTISDNYMMYGSRDMKHDRQNFLSFWTVFCPVTPWQPKKSKFWKTPGNIIILHKCTKNHNHILYCSLDMAHNRFNCYFSFWAFFSLFTSLTAQKIKIKKIWKKLLEIYYHFTIVYQDHDHMLYCSWDMVHHRCNYFSFWAIFCPFTPLTARKIKI